jgi:dienelactone hydrolase
MRRTSDVVGPLDCLTAFNDRSLAGVESVCSFEDRSGHARNFRLHLPPEFHDYSEWPLVLYFHGAAGESLFRPTKKTRNHLSVGISYAAARFVVVSPECQWNWKMLPGPWVLELVTRLSALSWFDPSRVYATGMSQGGMSCWELAASSPEVFAAIAPVAAHHHAEHRKEIAEALSETPILVAHSQKDECCKYAVESKLWQQLSECGNDPVVKVLEGAHCNSFADAYCKDIEIWEFLESHSREGSHHEIQGEGFLSDTTQDQNALTDVILSLAAARTSQAQMMQELVAFERFDGEAESFVESVLQIKANQRPSHLRSAPAVHVIVPKAPAAFPPARLFSAPAVRKLAPKAPATPPPVGSIAMLQPKQVPPRSLRTPLAKVQRAANGVRPARRRGSILAEFSAEPDDHDASGKRKGPIGALLLKVQKRQCSSA